MALLDPNALLQMWESNRRLTVRTIEAFPEDKLFQYAPAAPLRPFVEMVKEILDMEQGYVQGIATGDWGSPSWELKREWATKADVLATCAAVRERTRELWAQVTAERLLAVERDPWFGGEQPNMERITYALENEIHHRGQAFVYLRLLGLEPPAFYER